MFLITSTLSLLAREGIPLLSSSMSITFGPLTDHLFLLPEFFRRLEDHCVHLFSPTTMVEAKGGASINLWTSPSTQPVMGKDEDEIPCQQYMSSYFCLHFWHKEQNIIWNCSYHAISSLHQCYDPFQSLLPQLIILIVTHFLFNLGQTLFRKEFNWGDLV